VQDIFHDPIIDFQLGADTVANGASGGPLAYILPLIAALVLSMVIIPVMVRLAPRLGMIDKPDPRKVHATPIPRVGGVGIFFGALIPIALLLPIDQTLVAYLFGALVLFVFGVMDDCKELGHYVKFVGQFIAVIAVVYYGNVYVSLLPFMGGEPVPELVGKPFTVIAIVGMINAINHSDGLDGLAGGESLLSLGGIGYLAWLADGTTVTMIALATAGGLLGFMRFNTYPARIFMGDGGSQFLGYTLGVLAVLLTQEVNPVLSPALPLLLLGLPIADILAVFAQRIYHKMNWFRASKNHIHHRLLDLGFHHYESVIVVYTVQAMLVLCAVILPYAMDAPILLIYLVVVSVVFAALYLAERRRWRLRTVNEIAPLDKAIESATHSPGLQAIPFSVIYYGISAFLVTGALASTTVPVDFTLAATGLLALLVLRLVMGSRVWYFPLRLLAYVTIVFVVYLFNTYQPSQLSGFDPFTYVFFGALVVAIALSIRLKDVGDFKVTPMDFLVALVVIGVAVLIREGVVETGAMAIALKTIILFYGCEVILNRMVNRWNVFTLSVMASLLIISVRGVMGNYL
jgi:UDP-GlcNAc:undecaprenyl-phosphate GlcNAc-1-phosphate transferase